MSTLPNLILVGAAKTGSSSLFKMLDQHPDIFMARGKETGFFSNDSHYEKGLDWYRDFHFAEGSAFAVRGEATPSYICFEKAAKRMSVAFEPGAATYVLVLRNPVDRAYSWYWHMVRNGQEPLTFIDAVRSEPSRLQIDESTSTITRNYIESGQYGRQLENFWKHLSPDDFMIILYEDLKADTPGTVRKIFDRVGVDPHAEIAPITNRNQASTTRYPAVQTAIRTTSRVAAKVKPLLPARAYDLALRVQKNLIIPIYGWNQRPFTYPEMPREVRREVIELFRNDIRHLETLIDRDLSSWLTCADA